MPLSLRVAPCIMLFSNRYITIFDVLEYWQERVKLVYMYVQLLNTVWFFWVLTLLFAFSILTCRTMCTLKFDVFRLTASAGLREKVRMIWNYWILQGLCQHLSVMMRLGNRLICSFQVENMMICYQKRKTSWLNM